MCQRPFLVSNTYTLFGGTNFANPQSTTTSHIYVIQETFHPSPSSYSSEIRYLFAVRVFILAPPAERDREANSCNSPLRAC